LCRLLFSKRSQF
jgi:pentapeptide repeat protein